MPPDPLRIVEAAYRWEETDAAWLEGVITAATPCAVGAGVIACLVHCAPAPRVTAIGETRDKSRSLLLSLVEDNAQDLISIG